MKTAIRLSALIITSSLFAGTQAPEDESAALKKVMHSFASGLEQIQRGILYNDIEKMLKGVKELQTNEKEFLERHGKSLERHMPGDPEFVHTYAEATAKRIHDYTDKLRREINSAHEYSKIAATYTHILQSCVGCHQKIRKR